MPLRVDDLTPEWFTGALRSRGHEATVDQVEVIDAHSGTTGRARVALRGHGPLPASAFVKLAPFDEGQRDFIRFTGIGRAEARFYATAGTDLPVRAPSPLYADHGGDTFVMVLEDLLGAGCRFPERSEADDGERAASTVEELAKLHAAFWDSPRFETDLSWVPDQPGFGELDRPSAAAASGAYIRDAYVRFVDEMPAGFAAVGELYSTRTAEIFDLWDDGARTLVHGDCHIGNLFVDGNRTGFYDWALVSHAPGPRDVAYTCCYSMAPEARRALETDLLDLYTSKLVAGGVGADRGRVEDQYRLFAVFAWVSATATAAMGTKWQGEELSYRAMERATAAVDDLDSVGLLREHLD